MTTSHDTPERIPNLALQLYTLRQLGLPFEALVRQSADAGYSGVETVGDQVRAPDAREALTTHGIEVCSSHVPLDALETDLAGVCDANLAVGNRVLVVPWLPVERRGRDAASWQALGERLGELGARCRERGLQLLYHHHDFELGMVGGRSGLAWLMEAADAQDLGLEPDLGWAQRAGLDPRALLASFAGRCRRVHLKDVAPAGAASSEEGWADVGEGVMPWNALLPACREAGAEWLVVEHDAPLDPLGSARRSADNLRAWL